MNRSDLPTPPDYLVELVDLKTGIYVQRRLKMSWTGLEVDGVQRSQQTEYEITVEARKAFRDLEYQNGNWPPRP